MSYRFYADENFPLPTVRCLREREHDVLTAVEAGQANQRIPDEDVLRYASEQRRILLTLNRLDFQRIHNQSLLGHAGIMICRQHKDFELFARLIEKVLEEYGGQAENCLMRVNHP